MTLTPEKKSVKQRVILVMKQAGNARVLKKAVSEIDMTGVEVSTESDLKKELESVDSACSALVDVSGFGNEIWKMCEILHTRNIPFVVLSTNPERTIGNRSLSYGAASVLKKPVAKAALLELVKNLPDT